MKKIDMETFARKDHFKYFTSLDYPFVGFTVKVDVTDLVKTCKENKLSFFMMFNHAVALAANSVCELRQRILDDEIVEFDFCQTSHTEPLPNGTYKYCTIHHDKYLADFIIDSDQERKECLKSTELKEDEDALSMLFTSCIPWFSYSDITQPVSNNKDSNPRITWGKYEKDYNGRLMMPLSLLANHALVDGIHFGKFFDNVDLEMSNIVNELRKVKL